MISFIGVPFVFLNCFVKDFYCKISLQIPKIPKISRLRRATLTFLALTFVLKSANFQLKSAKPRDHGGAPHGAPKRSTPAHLV